MTYSSCENAERELRQMIDVARERPAARWHFIDNSGNDAARLLEWAYGLVNVRVTELPNPGFAGACNVAAEVSDARWLLFLNPDVEVTADDLDLVLGHAGSNEDRTLAISMVTNGVRHAGVAMRHKVWFVDAVVGSSDRVIGPSGGAGLFPRKLFIEQGGFYEPLFAWGEDADLAWRLHRQGYECAVLDLGLPHQGGHSIAGSKASTQFKVQTLYRNRLIVARRNLRNAQFVAFACAYAVALPLLLPKNAKRASGGASVRGFLDGLRACASTRRLP
ncbi:glycosyltransferase family 2 protein [Nocardioides sp. zg-1228]|uniref:glycosyltransferase family 2 protein n=1 Tax=Nocardioides sp. zg-1228 TaxID=2763008 RepID=UPI001642DD76|nr:glycosyltransferase [Nocardioides sp. zg-1228]MBC2931654.1 glycosyltransferase family 2 protein [Nocardioides sp. zg-1228]QSF57245.1 glycosyltransferase family 2 protein [Nocardioides sp. zg-1228]